MLCFFYVVKLLLCLFACMEIWLFDSFLFQQEKENKGNSLLPIKENIQKHKYIYVDEITN